MPTSKISELAKAMMFHEGWKPGSMSYRNNNPGNLRRSPLEDGHVGSWDEKNRMATFRTIVGGLAALIYDLECKCTGRTAAWHDADKDGVKDPGEELTPEDTLAEFFHCYAPAEDSNDPASYCAVVCKITGFTPDTKLKTLMEE